MDDDSQQTFLNIESEHEGPEQIFDKDVDKQLLAKALDSLDKKYKDVLLLRYGEDKDYQQISDILQIPNGTVATLIHRGKKELKKVLTKEK